MDSDLDWAQITYALNYERIVFVCNYKTWSNFHTENGFKYIDYTPEELSHRFLQHVLPNIYDYELTNDELHLLNLLDLHPHFVRTNSGFTMEPMKSLNFPSSEAAIEALTAQKGSFHERSLVGESVDSNRQIQIINSGNKTCLYRKFNFNAENAALLSVVLCSDENLSNCELLNIGDVYKRLKQAKMQFENNGQQLENINISLDDLLKKLNTIKKIKLAVEELVDISFRRKYDEN